MSHRRILIVLQLLSLFVLMTAGWSQAQEATPFPTTTPIPVEPLVTQDSAAPGLGNSNVTPMLIITPTLAATPAPAQPQPEATEAVSAEVPLLTLPDSPVCPALVQESFTAAEQVCVGIAPGEGCIGNGTVETVFASAVEGLQFSAPGNRVRLNSIKEMYVRTSNTSGNIWSVVSGRLELASTDGALPVAVTTLIFGDVTLIDTGEVVSSSAYSGTVLAQFGMNVRRTPDSNGAIVWQLSAAEQITVTGRTPDREWLRIVIPNQFAGVGWVYAPYVEVDGGVDQLPFVTVDSPAPQLSAPDFGPLQSLEMLSALTPPDCDPSVPDSGMLLQTPNGVPDNVRIRINGAVIEWNGTIFVQGLSDALQINLLEGQMSVTGIGETATTSAGNIIFVPMNADLQPAAPSVLTALDLAIVNTLPLRLLPRVFVVNTMVFVDSSTESEDSTAQILCGLRIPDEVRNLRTGPGTDYPVQRVAQPGEMLSGAGQARDPLGYVWYQTNEGGWIRIDAVSASEPCASLPAVQAPPPPQPTATPTNDPALRALSSSTLGAVTCPGGQVSTSTTWDGSDLFVALGGTWTVSAGTTVTFSTQGGQLRPEFGSYIRLIAEDGSTIAESGSGRELRLTFDQNRTFTARFSAGNGDLVLIAARCDG
jgi:uncharacterized protein YraI